MITEYHRPRTLEEALQRLAQPNTLPLGGGTKINSPAFKDRDFAVVDLQALEDLKRISRSGYTLDIGAAATLQALLESADAPAALQQAIQQEASLNIRNAATVAGTLVSADGRSPFATAMLALDAKITVISKQSSVISLAEYWALRPAGLISLVSIPLNVKLAYEQVARTPQDAPIVCAALSQWKGGRTRLALGGYGAHPRLAMDGTEADGLQPAARNAFQEANDPWASAEYRMEVAAVLAKRCLESVRE
ncbi:MAG: xanthine dehydrogenase family protein subunit M [Anaerolineales bacterium]